MRAGLETKNHPLFKLKSLASTPIYRKLPVALHQALLLPSARYPPHHPIRPGRKTLQSLSRGEGKYLYDRPGGWLGEGCGSPVYRKDYWWVIVIPENSIVYFLRNIKSKNEIYLIIIRYPEI